ncbi:Gfo/Idh/MocA family oxidoreductase [Pelagibius marinus]|uniref:Gfo/Idh/MocA family oxidoreductase n=1 Tax=Pelagibius marinus TaxID=2762760 RepID=UPI0018722F93|nr:Gfo/Idh/MocA family oxidoreductase [Pelagibius marinus]
MTNFALIGAAGFVAPRHMKAMRAVGGDLKAAIDPNDSVGIMDSHFPEAHFFTEFERFDRYIDKQHRSGERIDYVSICSPNYLHDAHVRFALRSDCDAICEKPLVLNPWNLDGLAEIEASTGRRINTILQLRLHPAIIALKQKVDASDRRHSVNLSYVTSRGRWYHQSWKGDDKKSGGVGTNIGVHFFDMLSFVFGAVTDSALHLRNERQMAGFIECEKADIRWFLSVDRNDLLPGLAEGQSTYRAVTVDGEDVEFSAGFTDLHTASYEAILAGKGFGLEAVRPSIEMVSAMRTADIEPGRGERHPMVPDAR